MKIYTDQLQDKEKIIATLERQLKNIREEYKSLQNEVESSRTTTNNYKERLLQISSELERLNAILLKKGAEND